MAKVKKIQIINGPNLDLQGIRQPEIYGTQTFDDLLRIGRERFPEIEIRLFQSNHEGELIEKIHHTNAEGIPIILNLAAFTHTSYALADALAAVQVPVVEVHISNILGREEWRARSLTARYCRGVIIGFGLDGYLLAMEALTGHYNLHL